MPSAAWWVGTGVGGGSAVAGVGVTGVIGPTNAPWHQHKEFSFKEHALETAWHLYTHNHTQSHAS